MTADSLTIRSIRARPVNVPLARPIIAEPLVVEDGMVRPQGVGLWITWNEETVERYLV